jgi:hypothetical protein
MPDPVRQLTAVARDGNPANRPIFAPSGAPARNRRPRVPPIPPPGPAHSVEQAWNKQRKMWVRDGSWWSLDMAREQPFRAIALISQALGANS